MQRYLILGANGFIATYLWRALTALGHVVHRWGTRQCRDENLQSTVGLAWFIDTNGPFDVVINCTGDARMFHVEEHPVDSLVDNVMTAINVVQVLKRLLLLPRLYHISSCMASEPMNFYGLHKRLAEEHIDDYNNNGTRACAFSVRPGAVYGPGMKKGPVYDALIAVRDGGGKMWLDPDASIPVTNVRKLVQLVLEEEEPAAEYPFGCGADLTGCVSCRNLVALVAAAAQRPVPKVEYGDGFIPHPFQLQAVPETEFVEAWQWLQEADVQRV